MFKYLNTNPMLNEVEDCTIRALSVAENISWDKAYQILCNYARKRGLMLSSVASIESFLDDNYISVKTYEDETLQEFVERHKHGTYLITMRGHITVLKDGIIYDTFNPLNRVIWGAWRV